MSLAGADSTCLWHVLAELGYRVSALHVNHGLRGEESDVDARFCREVLGAEVVDAPAAETEAELRDIRYSYATDRLRATGHTASDNVETVLYRLVSSGRPGGIKPKREDGIVRPLLTVWGEETEAYCREVGLPYRTDSTNLDTKRGLIRSEILPLLEQLDSRARANLLALAERPRAPPSAHARAAAARAAGLHRRHEGGRPRPRDPSRPRVRPPDARARPGPVRPVDDRIRRTGARGAHVAAGRSPRRPHPESPGRVHGREGAAPGAQGLAARRSRGRGCLDPRDRGQSRGESEALIEITSELERGVGDVLIDADALRGRIAELGDDISDHYRGRDLLLVGVLKGAVFFMADLMRHVTVPCEVDFMAITSYGASTDSSGVVRILKDLDINIEGRHVLVVEDIVDSGLTLSYLIRNLESREPASLEVCALMTKPSRREIDVPVRWVGFEIPNKFVIGYGLDFAERYRNLPYVGVLSEDLIPEGA